MRRRDFVYLLGGATTARPLATLAQQKAMPVIGWLSGGSPGPYAPFVDAFRQSLSESGYAEGQNVAIEYRWAEGHYDRLPLLAEELVARKVDTIVATGSDVSPRAAKAASRTIPIVFNFAGDPVAEGLIASIARPGGNLTGVSFLTTELSPKRFELIQELVPQAGTIAMFVNPSNSRTDRMVQLMQAAARKKAVQLAILQARSENEIDSGFATLVQRRASALIVDSDPIFNVRREQIVALAARHAVPAIYGFRESVTAGGLISYGSSLTGVYRQLGVFAGKILKGAQPADLPVQQPTAFELVINLKTAKALGLAIPPSILARADEVIE